MSSGTKEERPSADLPQAVRGDLHCSFCRKSQDQVRKLIAGPDVYICDECVDLCIDILERESVAESTTITTPLHAIGSCALCKLPKDVMELRMIGDQGVLCIECIDAVRGAAEPVEQDKGAT